MKVASNFKVFICYRRKSGVSFANQVARTLSESFGEDNVVIDTRAVGPGVGIRKRLGSKINECGAMVVVLDSSWTTSKFLNSLKESDNYIYNEISHALQLGLPIIPVKPDSAKVIRPGDLPSSIREVEDLLVISVRDGHFEADIESLVVQLKNFAQVADSPAPLPPAPPPPPIPVKWKALAKIAACVGIVSFLVFGTLRLIEPVVTPMALSTKYHPGGYMGDWGTEELPLLKFSKSSDVVHGEPVPATNVTYTPDGRAKWAGSYWLHPDKNWGKEPGLDLSGYQKITFFAKGKRGGEIVKFLSGGITELNNKGKHSVSIEVVLGSTWKSYVIDLREQDLSMVIGAFGFAVAFADNGNSEVSFSLAKMTLQ